MDLVPYTDADRWLIEALETDPAVMADLGGPWPLDRIAGIHERRLAYVAAGAWYLKIVPERGARPVGSVSLWHSEWEGRPVSEASWMVLPEHQGRGYATAAVRLLLERARLDGQWGVIHAFTGVTNGASNALCRKVGFQLAGETDIEYGGRHLRCRHWTWPVTSAG